MSNKPKIVSKEEWLRIRKKQQEAYLAYLKEKEAIKKAIDEGFPEHEYPPVDYEGEYEELMG